MTHAYHRENTLFGLYNAILGHSGQPCVKRTHFGLPAIVLFAKFRYVSSDFIYYQFLARPLERMIIGYTPEEFSLAIPEKRVNGLLEVPGTTPSSSFDSRVCSRLYEGDFTSVAPELSRTLPIWNATLLAGQEMVGDRPREDQPYENQTRLHGGAPGKKTYVRRSSS